MWHKMSHHAAFHLNLHCLPNFTFMRLEGLKMAVFRQQAAGSMKVELEKMMLKVQIWPTGY